MTTNVLSGLKKKRTELSKQLLNHRTEMHRTIAALDSLDSTIRLYDPKYKPESDYNRAQGKINRKRQPNRILHLSAIEVHSHDLS